MANGWKGPKEITPQLLEFANAYYTAVGRERSLAKAAMKAGVSKKSAAQMGYMWSKYDVVKKFWRDASLLGLTSAYAGQEHVLQSLEEIASSVETDTESRILAGDTYMKHVINMYSSNSEDSENSAPKDVVAEDESTLNTIAQISKSINLLVNNSCNTEKCADDSNIGDCHDN